MTISHHFDVAHSVAAGLLVCATAYSFTHVSRPSDYRQPELSNHELVVANMTADLQDFHMCTEQAAMLAEQTADFGVLGLMTTVAAVGIDTDSESRNIAIEGMAFDEDVRRAPMLAARAK